MNKAEEQQQQNVSVATTTPKSARSSVKKRHSGKIKNLEEEVEFILSQDELENEEPVLMCLSDDEVQGGTATAIAVATQSPATPVRTRRAAKEAQPPTPNATAPVQTPRRSVRKSIKPAQDYEDIVAKKSMRSLKKEKPSSIDEEEEAVAVKDAAAHADEVAPRWTPAKVGRGAQRRKSRRTKGKKLIAAVVAAAAPDEQRIRVDAEVLEVIANDEDENKENVEPNELLKNRKTPKDHENEKGFRRSQESVLLSSAEKKQQQQLKLQRSSFEKRQQLQAVQASPSPVREAVKVVKETVKDADTKLIKIVKEKPVEELVKDVVKKDVNDSVKESVGQSVKEVVKESVNKSEINVSNESKNAANESVKDSVKDVVFKVVPESLNCSVEESVKEMVNSSVKETLKESLTESLNESVIEIVEESVNESVMESVDKSVKESVNDAVYESVIEHGKEDKINSKPVELKSKTHEDLELDLGLKSTDMEKQCKELNSASFTIATTATEEVQNNNETFDASLCVFIALENEAENQQKYANIEKPAHEDEEQEDSDCFLMQPLVLSDDDDDEDDIFQKQDSNKTTKTTLDQQPTAVKMPKIVITDDEQLSQTFCSSPLPPPTPTAGTATTATAATVSNTPTQRPKLYRFPTPYKMNEAKNLSFEFNKNAPLSDDDDDNSQELPPQKKMKQDEPPQLPPTMLKLTTLEPREFLLRSIRKRSLSLCNDPRPKKHNNRVKFDSPANQTVVIEDLDLLIAQSTRKAAAINKKNVNVDFNMSNITTRRKRSLSVDESFLQTRLKAKSALPISKYQQQQRNTPQKTRTKIPNFAAIHQRQFNKMENLLDHVSRKAERAKILTNSATKILTPSAKKQGFPARNQNIDPTIVGGGAGAAHNARGVVKSKALKKIDLSHIEVVRPTAATAVTAVRATTATQKIADPINDSDDMTANVCNLPNPMLFQKIAVVQPLQASRQLHQQQSHKQQQQQQQPAKRPYKPTQLPSFKPAFNLSTHIVKPATVAAPTTSAAKQLPINVKPASVPQSSYQSKMTERRQRHMAMYKGRGTSGRATARAEDKSSEIIRGVRSNRRFDLHMQHRKNMQNTTTDQI